jgi:hypothetical protein
MTKRGSEMLTDEILRNGRATSAWCWTFRPGSSWLMRRMAELRPIVLVPMAAT